MGYSWEIPNLKTNKQKTVFIIFPLFQIISNIERTDISIQPGKTAQLLQPLSHCPDFRREPRSSLGLCCKHLTGGSKPAAPISVSWSQVEPLGITITPRHRALKVTGLSAHPLGFWKQVTHFNFFFRPSPEGIQTFSNLILQHTYTFWTWQHSLNKTHYFSLNLLYFSGDLTSNFLAYSLQLTISFIFEYDGREELSCENAGIQPGLRNDSSCMGMSALPTT